MATTRSYALADHLAAFIETEVAEGHYASESDVVSAGLRLLEERAHKLSALRNALAEGEASGDAAPLDVDAFVKERRARDAASTAISDQAAFASSNAP